MFSEAEIRSKTWTSSLGQRIVLLDWTVFHLKRADDLIIAKYGIKTGEEVLCIELYRPVRLPPKLNSFLLLEHDYEPAKVVALNVQDGENKTVIQITREAEVMSQWRHQSYAFCYGSGNTISRDAGEWWW